MAASCSPDPSSAAQPVKPGLFSLRKIDGFIDLVAGISWLPERAYQVMQFNAPNAHKPGPIPARFSAPKNPGFGADKPFTRSPNRLGEWVFPDTFGARGG